MWKSSAQALAINTLFRLLLEQQVNRGKGQTDRSRETYNLYNFHKRTPTEKKVEGKMDLLGRVDLLDVLLGVLVVCGWGQSSFRALI